MYLLTFVLYSMNCAAPDDFQFSPCVGAVISEYELQRQATIRRNQEILRQLGLASPVRLVPDSPPARESRRAVKKAKSTANAAVSKTIAVAIGVETRRRAQTRPFHSASHTTALVRCAPAMQIYQCAKCWRVLCDDRLCVAVPAAHAASASVQSLMDEFLVVTAAHEVELDSFIAVASDARAPDAGCLFVDVACACGVDLGRFYVATTPLLDSVRHMFALRLSALRGYVFGSLSDAHTRTRAEQHAALAAVQRNAHDQLGRVRSMQVSLCALDDDLDVMAAALAAPLPPPPASRSNVAKRARVDDDAAAASFSDDNEVFSE